MMVVIHNMQCEQMLRAQEGYWAVLQELANAERLDREAMPLPDEV